MVLFGESEVHTADHGGVVVQKCHLCGQKRPKSPCSAGMDSCGSMRGGIDVCVVGD